MRPIIYILKQLLTGYPKQKINNETNKECIEHVLYNIGSVIGSSDPSSNTKIKFTRSITAAFFRRKIKCTELHRIMATVEF